MENEPPSKRPRFFIEELLSDIPSFQTGNGQQINNLNLSPSHYVTILDKDIEFNKKFKLLKNRSSFLIENIPSDPESNKRGVVANKIGIIISSELLQPDLWLPIRGINENTVDALLNRFNHIAQSKAKDDISLWGKPFEVSVTTIGRNDLPNEQQIIGGVNIRKKRSLAPIHHNINDQCLIKVNKVMKMD
uniref:Uncharacterized protein n=1 Tax=Meloidogyne javanica TaxID=6303 RepID=A0A915N111_MELJA